MGNEEKILEILAGMSQQMGTINERLDRMDERLDKMDERLDRMDERLDKMQNDMDEMKETLEEHSISLDALIEWTDNVQEVVRVPFAKAKTLRPNEGAVKTG